MDSENQNTKTLPENTVIWQLVPESTPVTTPTKKNNWFIVILSIFIVILLAFVGYLYYQNINLQKQIVSLQSSPTPIATTDPTNDWETYVDESSEVTTTVTAYLKNKGYDLNKTTINKPQKLGSLTSVYSVGWTETGAVGGGSYVLVGKKDNEWIVPENNDSTYCEWIKTSGLDEATQAFMGPGCNSNQ